MLEIGAEEGERFGLNAVEIENKLRVHGIVPTSQRCAIALLLFAEPIHFCVEELCERLQTKNINLSKATVYNTLNLFVECGLIRELRIDGTTLKYDSRTSQHQHMYIQDTGEIIDIENIDLARCDDLIIPKGYEIAGVDIIVKLTPNRIT